MDKEKPVVYDPNPLDVELEIVQNFTGDNMDISDLAKPEVVRFILQNQKIALSKLKVTEKEISILSEKNLDLMKDRENLRINLAKRAEWNKVTWLEIPISILSGFSINMLTKDSSDTFGWILLVVSLMILISLRGANSLKKSKNNSSEEE